MAAGGETVTTSQGDSKAVMVEQVHIAPNGVGMPLGRIVLIRRGSEYCAVKFKETWTKKFESARFTNYESYYQGDGTGDFSNKNVQFTKDTLEDRYSVFGRLFPLPFGHRNLYIKFGAIKLLWSYWSYGSTVYFSESPDRGGVELAPTKWTDISQVDVFDKRLKWYRYDGNRKDMYIPIDQLWEDGEVQK